MNQWAKIDRHARRRQRAWLVGRICILLLSVAVLASVGFCYYWR